MLCPMFIRRARTGTGERGEVYYSHRLVRSERSGEKVLQRTLLNLGSDFAVERRRWASCWGDFERMSPMRLYRASDALMARRAAIEARLFDRATDLFGLRHTVTLCDLTNTFFEGAAAAQPKAERGHSREKRSDCPLLTLGLVLDGSGFVRRCEVFSGAVNEDGTLASMLGPLGAPAEALVVTDAGIATGANIAWLRENGYRYLAVSRDRTRRFDPELALAIETRSHQTVHVRKAVDAEGGEARLYCYSEARAKKEQGIANRFAARFEGERQKLHDGLKRPRTRKRLAPVWQRIARIREKSRGGAAHYDIDVIADDSGEKVRCRHLGAPPARRRHGHPSRRLLPAHQPRGLGRGGAVADLHLLDRCRGGVPIAQVGTRPAPHLPPHPEALRRPPVHHRDRLPDGADHPPTPRRAGRIRQPGQPQSHPRRPVAHHRDLQAQGRPHLACPQGHTGRARTAGNLSRPRDRPRPWRHQENDRLIPNRAKEPKCSARRKIIAP